MIAELRIVKLGWSDKRPDNAFLLNELVNGREVRVWAKWQHKVCGSQPDTVGVCVWEDVPVTDEQNLFRRYDEPGRYAGLPFVPKPSDYLLGDSGPAAIHREAEEVARQFDNEYPNSPVDKFFMGYRTAARKYKPDAKIAGRYAENLRKIKDKLQKLAFVVDQFLVKPDKLAQKDRKRLANQYKEVLESIVRIE